jgi:hypothetical protein
VRARIRYEVDRRVLTPFTTRGTGTGSGSTATCTTGAPGSTATC